MAGLCAAKIPAIVYRDQGNGAALSTQAAILAACDASDTKNHVLLLEDDVTMCGDAPAIIRGVASRWPPDVGVISFCDMREVREGAAPGIYQVSAYGCDGLGWWGDQALLIHRDIVRQVAVADWWSDEIETHPGVRAHMAVYSDGGTQCADKRLGMVVSATIRPEYAVHVPSLFRHDGNVSLCFDGRSIGERATRNLHPSLQESQQVKTLRRGLASAVEYTIGYAVPREAPRSHPSWPCEPK